MFPRAGNGRQRRRISMLKFIIALIYGETMRPW